MLHEARVRRRNDPAGVVSRKRNFSLEFGCRLPRASRERMSREIGDRP